MSLKTEKLTQRIGQLQEYAASKASANPAYVAINMELNQLAESLAVGKPLIHIVSPNAHWSQSFQAILAAHKGIAEVYEVKVKTSPWDVAPEIPQHPSLVFQDVRAVANGQARLALLTHDALRLGRDKARVEVLIADDYRGVSGCHAEIKPIESNGFDNTKPAWELCDLGSRNGTFVNGERIEKPRSLWPGDRIVLGGSPAAATGVEVVFEQQAALPSKADELYDAVTDCDVLCLVLPEGAIDSQVAKKLIAMAGRKGVSKLIMAFDCAGARQPDAAIASLADWARGLSSIPQIDSVSLPLGGNSVEELAKDEQLQSEVKSLCEAIENLAKRKPEELFVNRINTCLAAQAALADKLLAGQESKLKQECQKAEEQLGNAGLDELKERLKGQLKQVGEDKDRCFRQLKLDLNLAKNAALDEFNRSSLLNKVQRYGESLEPALISRNNHKFMSLTAPDAQAGGNADAAMLDLCQSELRGWAEREWDRIRRSYAEGGLEGLSGRVQRNLNQNSAAISLSAFTPPAVYSDERER